MRQPRVVGITGGTRGVGLAVANLFHARGEAVAVCAQSLPAHRPDGILHYRADVRSREMLKSFVATIVERLGALDVFVNCAGVSRWKPVGEIDEPFVHEVIETSLLGTLWGCAAAAAEMRAGGCIVNVSSLAGKRGSANNSAYCAAKFAVNGMTQALAKELGPRGIRVNAVCPVYVETASILSALAEPASPARGEPVHAYLASFTSRETALGRLPSADDVAEAVHFLASSAAAAITGQCINIDCGVLPQ